MTMAVQRELPVAQTDDLWSRWLANYRSARTQDAYKRDVTAWGAWCSARGINVVHPVPDDMTAWVGELRAAGRSEATLARRVSAACSFYQWARHEGVTDARPEPFRRPRPQRDAVTTLGLDPGQVHAILEAALSKGDTERNYAFVSLLVFCGLRVSEALGADVTDLSSARGHQVGGLSVVGLDPPRSLVLHYRMDLATASPASTGSRVILDWTWAFVLEPVEDGCRLVVRVRADPRPSWCALLMPLLEPVHFVMERKMLRTIKRRAEAGNETPTIASAETT